MFIFTVIIVAVAVIFILKYNKFKTFAEDVEQQKSSIDVALNSRYDTIMQMQQTVKGYMGHEADTLIKISSVRSGMSVEEMANSENQMAKAVSQMYAVAENHPQLRASENFMMLQKIIANCEDNLQAARRSYNSAVAEFNKAISVFPGNIVASIIHLSKASFFEINDSSKRDLVNLDFSR